MFYLACARRSVSRDKLTFLLFPDDTDSSARRKLTRVLSQLQSQFPGIPLCNTDNSTVLLNPEILWTDVVEFDSLGDLPYCQEQAVEIYRGPFLEGFSLTYSLEYDRWLTEQRQLYENRYLSLLEQFVHQSIESCDHKKGIQYALKYLEVDELAEHMHRSLIELYHAAGNRSAAIRQYETCVIMLERELGVEPLPETHEVYKSAAKGLPQQKSFNHNPQWSVIPSLTVPLVGREKAWEELQTAYTRFQTGGFILIKGEAGIGKSRLVQEFASRGSKIVLTGNCFLSTQSLPYHPVIQALRKAISHPDLWEPIRPIWLAEAALLLPELEDIFPSLPSPIHVEPGQAQARLYEGLTQCFLGLASNSGLLLCLDDLHWMDEATKGWLVILSGRLAGSRLCILGAYRVEEGDTIADVKESFSRRSLLEEISLSGLTLDAIQEVLLQLPEPPPDPEPLAKQIALATGGNTFFILETLRTLLESSALASPFRELPIAHTVQEAVQQRLTRLSPVARQVLEAAAVLTPDLKYDLIRDTSGRSEVEVSEGLEELFQRQLLSDGEKRLFKHDLVSQAVYRQLTPGRSRLLHRRAAKSFGKVYQGRQDEAAAQIARHYDRAGEAQAAVGFYTEAARAARQRYAHEEAISFLNRALELSSRLSASPSEIAHLHELTGESLEVKGDFEASRAAYQRGLVLIGCEDVLQQANVLVKILKTFLAQREIQGFEEIFEVAVRLLGPGPQGRDVPWQRAWLNLQLARLELLYFQANVDEMGNLINRIAPVLEENGSQEQHLAFLRMQIHFFSRQERFLLSYRTVRLMEKMMDIVAKRRDPVSAAYIRFGLGFSYLMYGDLEKAVEELTGALKMAEQIEILMTQCQCMIYLAHIYRLKCDPGAVRRYATRSLEIAQQLGVPVYIASAHAQLAWTEWRDGKQVEAKQKASDAINMWGEFPHAFKWYAYWVLFAIALEKEQIREAVEAAKSLLHPTQQRLPDDINAVLQSGIDKWESGDIQSAQKFLKRSVEIGRARGYL